MPSSLDLAGRLAGVVAVQQEILGAVTDLDRVLQLIVERTGELTRGTGAVIELVDRDELVYRAASGVARKHVGLYLPMSGSLSGEVVSKKMVLRCDDCDTDPRVDREACRMIGLRSMIIAPLLEGDQAIGVLKAFSDKANGFDDLDAYVIQLIAGMTSAALSQARAFQERRASEERYRLLFERNVAGVFRSTRDGRILDCNDALATYFGYSSREEFMAQPTWDLYQQRAEREALLKSLEQEPALTNVRLHFKRKDGSPMTALMNVSILAASGGEQLLGTIVADVVTTP
jgi:PAS domain S-box-containing protein